MAADKKPTPGVSSRRSACDRCRGQKLRCLRKGGDSQGRCDRCAKAGTSCATSPIYRMRNYLVDDEGNAVSRRRRRPNNRPSTHPPQSPRIITTTLASSGPTVALSSDSLSMSAAAQTTPTTAGAAPSFEWHFENTMQGSSSGAMTVNFTMPPPPSPDWGAFTEPATPAFSTPVVTSADVWDHNDLTIAQIYAAENADKNTTTSFNNPAGDSMTQHAYPVTHLPQALQLQQSHTPEGMHWSLPQPQHQSVSNYVTHGNANSPSMMSYQANETENKSHDQMQMLTNINLNLVTQLKQLTDPQTNLNVLISFNSGNHEQTGSTVLEGIMNMTREFLNILDMVAGMSHMPLATHASPPTAWATGVYGGYTSGSESASISAYDSDMNSPSDSSGTAQLSPASSSVSLPPPPPATTGFNNSINSLTLTAKPTTTTTTDSAAVLLIITCYVHILRIHVALFWHIQQHLQVTSDLGERAMAPVHDMCHFGSFPLQSGNLQVTMLIQLVAHAFKRMETILGLPRELCLEVDEPYDDAADGQRPQQQQQQQQLQYSPYHGGGGGGGMLDDEGLLDVARTIIGKEDTGRPQEGKGGIRSLRRDIMRAKHAFRVHMAP